MNDMTTLRIAIGDYPHTLPLKRGEITSPSLKLDFVEVKPMHKAFKPMVREHAFDASEMALVTYLQAKAYNKGLRLLPAAMLARFQHGCMLFNAARGKLDPANLPGCRGQRPLVDRAVRPSNINIHTEAVFFPHEHDSGAAIEAEPGRFAQRGVQPCQMFS